MKHSVSGGNAGYIEFVILVALIKSLVALSIDAMLPAWGRQSLVPCQP